MDKYLKEIEVAVQKAGIEGTLTEAAVEQFNGVIQKCDELTDKCVKLEMTQGRMEKEKKELDALFAQTSSKLNDYQTRERELVEREQDNLKLRLNAEHQAARVTDHKEMVRLVFRNSVLKKVVATPVSVNDQGMQGHTELDHVEEEET